MLMVQLEPRSVALTVYRIEDIENIRNLLFVFRLIPVHSLRGNSKRKIWKTDFCNQKQISALAFSFLWSSMLFLLKNQISLQVFSPSRIPCKLCEHLPCHRCRILKSTTVVHNFWKGETTQSQNSYKASHYIKGIALQSGIEL